MIDFNFSSNGKSGHLDTVAGVAWLKLEISKMSLMSGVNAIRSFDARVKILLSSLKG